MITEIHTMKPFRGTEMGVIRLDHLAQQNMSIKIGEKEICPIGYDTYGHPVISKRNFQYYKALKANHSRESKTFLLKVEYEEMPFCIKKRFFDSIEAISDAVSDEKEGLSRLKQILVWRKQFYFSKREALNKFILFNKYLMTEDGHVYYLEEYISKNQAVIQVNDSEELIFSKEAHIPDSDDVCPICGKHFTLKDVQEGIISENNNAEKHHKDCYTSFFEEVELSIASQIIDAVYEEMPINTCRENGVYSYDTLDGKISISFQDHAIVIDFSQAKKFDISILGQESNKKFVIAYSRANAIQYLEKLKMSN